MCKLVLLLFVSCFALDPYVHLGNIPFQIQVQDNQFWKVTKVLIGGEKAYIQPKWIEKILSLKVKAITESEFPNVDPMLINSNFLPQFKMNDDIQSAKVQSIFINDEFIDQLNRTIISFIPKELNLTPVNDTINMLFNKESDQQFYLEAKQIARQTTNQTLDMIEQLEGGPYSEEEEIIEDIDPEENPFQSIIDSIIPPREVVNSINIIRQDLNSSGGTIDPLMEQYINQTIEYKNDTLQQYQQYQEQAQEDYNQDEIIDLIDKKQSILDFYINQLNSKTDDFGTSDDPDVVALRTSLNQLQKQLEAEKIAHLIDTYKLLIPSPQAEQSIKVRVRSQIKNNTQTMTLYPGYFYKLDLYDQIKDEKELSTEIGSITATVKKAMWVRSVVRVPQINVEIPQIQVNLSKNIQDTLSGVNVTFNLTDILQNRNASQFSITIQVAPIYLLNNPSDCMKRLGWFVEKKLSSLEGTVNITLPLTTLSEDLSYVYLSAENATNIFSVVKPLVVIGLNSAEIITEKLMSDETIQKLEEGQQLSLQELLGLNNQIEKVTSHGVNATSKRLLLEKVPEDLMVPQLLNPYKFDFKGKKALQAKQKWKQGGLKELTKNLDRFSPPTIPTEDIQYYKIKTNEILSKVYENVETFGDVMEKELTSDIFSQCWKQTNDYQMPYDAGYAIQGDVQARIQTRSYLQDAANSGCPPDGSCSGNGVCVSVSTRPNPRTARYVCRCFAEFTGTSCEFKSFQIEDLTDIYLHAANQVLSTNLSNSTNSTDGKLYIDNLLLLTASPLMTQENIDMALNSLEYNLPYLTNTSITSVFQVISNLKEKLLNNVQIQQVSELRSIAKQAMNLLSKRNDILNEQQIYFNTKDSYGLFTQFNHNLSNQTFTLFQSLQDPITKMSMALPYAMIPPIVANSSRASSISLSISDCSYYPDFDCQTPVVEFTLRDINGTSVDFRTENYTNQTYTIALPIYNNNLTSQNYSCVWLKSIDGVLALSKEGCKVTGFNQYLITCECTHLTQFTTQQVVQVYEERPKTVTTFEGFPKTTATSSYNRILAAFIIMMFVQL